MYTSITWFIKMFIIILGICFPFSGTEQVELEPGKKLGEQWTKMVGTGPRDV